MQALEDLEKEAIGRVDEMSVNFTGRGKGIRANRPERIEDEGASGSRSKRRKKSKTIEDVGESSSDEGMGETEEEKKIRIAYSKIISIWPARQNKV